MFRFFILILFLLLLPDAYIWWNYLRMQSGLWRIVLLFLPTIATLLCMLLLVCQVRASMLMQYAFIMIICIAVPKLVYVIVDIVGKGIAWQLPHFTPYVHRVALILAVCMAALQVWGTGFGWRILRVEHTHIKLPHMASAFNEYKIVQISDIHLGSYAGDTSIMKAMVDSINKQKPDLIVFTGDMVNTASSEVLPFIRILRKLKAKDGVLSVLGNHDYCLYQPGLSANELHNEVCRIVRAQRAMGWQVLLNEHKVIKRGNDSLVVVGVENIGKPPFPSHGNLKKAMQGINPNACTVLLSHDPWHWRNEVVKQTKIDLTLSGHTHALQMQVGHFSPAAWFMPEWGGMYHQGEQKLFVSTGIGGNVPYRLGAWPKIEVLTLHN